MALKRGHNAKQQVRGKLGRHMGLGKIGLKEVKRKCLGHNCVQWQK